MSLWTDIASLNTWANECRLILVNLEDDLDWRTNSSYNLSLNGGIGYVAWANRAVIADLIEAMQYFVYGQTSSYNYVKWNMVHTGLYYQETEITWESIAEAWAKDDFKGAAFTIAFIDRMRQLIWDKPFYVQWASKPEEQGL